MMKNFEDDRNHLNGDENVVDDLAEEFYEADIEDDMDNAYLVDEDQYDDAQLVFSKHEGSVFVVEVNSNGMLAVSGGEDDKAYVWEIATGNILFDIQGKDSVTCACFNADSSMVAIGDMSGLIKVWNVSSRKQIWEFETSDLEWLVWHPVAPVLMAGTQDGDAWLWKVPSGECKAFQSPGCACSCGRILPDGKSAAVGYNDGSIRIFDLKSQASLHTLSKGKDVHTGCVHHLDFSADGQTLITGSDDGTVKIININSGKVSATYCNENHRRTEESESDSIECVGYSNSLSLIAAASLNGDVTVWDTKTGQIRTNCKHPEGVTRSLWDSNEKIIYTACLDGVCRQWNARSGELMNTFAGHCDQIYDLALTKDDRWLLSASADGSVRVFDITKPSPST